MILTIDGRSIEVEPGTSILEAAREAGIRIPTLCYHEALAPVGSCRLCMVEVKHRGRERLAASCVTPCEEGMEVVTDSERVLEIRRMLVELLLARCPGVEFIQRMARDMGIERCRFREEDDDCFLCGLCVRACAEIVGQAAIGFTNRGVHNQVGSPFEGPTVRCIECGTCTTICPARTFHLEKVRTTHSMHSFEEGHREHCMLCGEYYTLP